MSENLLKNAQMWLAQPNVGVQRLQVMINMLGDEGKNKLSERITEDLIALIETSIQEGKQKIEELKNGVK